MHNNFSSLNLSPEILKAIDEMGFVEPTKVQSEAIPTILNHQDVIVMSKTGSGKTAVFGIPILQMTDPLDTSLQGLILTPTRELAVQVDSDLKRMSKYLGHKSTVVYGQHSINVELAALKKGVSIVTGTPGRVYDHIQQRNIDTRNIKFLVLDEADRMLDMGFLVQVVRIIKTLPQKRITLLFSATIPPEIQKISRDFMNYPSMIEIESPTLTVDTIKQFYYRINRNEKQTILNRLLIIEQPQRCMIFCNTKIAVDHVQSFLTRKGYFAQSLHGDIPQSKRTSTIEQFKTGVFRILVATDVAARGIHIDDLSLVINYDVPLEKDSYVHRIGRTGRAGNQGLAITFVTSDDIMSLYAIEEHIGSMIDEGEFPSESYYLERKSEADEWIKENAIKLSHNPVVNGSVSTKSKVKNSDTRPVNKRNSKKPNVNKSDSATEKSDAVLISNTPNHLTINKKGSSSKISRSAVSENKDNFVNAKKQFANTNTSSSQKTSPAPAPYSAAIQMKSPVNSTNTNSIPVSSSTQKAVSVRRAHFRTFGDDDNTTPINTQATSHSPVSRAVNSASHKEVAHKKTVTPNSAAISNPMSNPANNDKFANKPVAYKTKIDNSNDSDQADNNHFLKRIFNNIFKKK